jgi:hypothetical protein
MAAGRVSLSAKDATIAQILAEWAKVGQTKIVNAERVGGVPLTLELTNVPEVEALEILLRSAGGYLLAPRRAEMANASRYDRILILPQGSPISSPVRVAAAPAPVAPPPRPFAPPQAGQLTNQAPTDDDAPADRPVAANPGVQSPRPPVFNTFPQAAPQRTATPPPPATAPTATVTAPAGVSVPGMVVATPPPAGQTSGQPAGTTPQPQR